MTYLLPLGPLGLLQDQRRTPELRNVSVTLSVLPWWVVSPP